MQNKIVLYKWRMQKSNIEKNLSQLYILQQNMVKWDLTASKLEFNYQQKSEQKYCRIEFIQMSTG